MALQQTDALEDTFGEGHSMYGAVYKNMYTHGLDYDQAVVKAEDAARLGGYRLEKVVYAGEDVFLADLCVQYSASYLKVLNRIRKGWPVWNALVALPETYPNSIESDTHWYPNKESLAKHRGVGICALRARLKNSTVEEAIAAIKAVKEIPTISVTIGGKEFVGTAREISEQVGIGYNAVMDRYNGKFGDGNPATKTKIYRYAINGETKLRAQWCEYYKVPKNKISRLMCKKGMTFKEALISLGVDLSNTEVLAIV